MKIAFIVSSFPEVSETFILRQITGLLNRGHDVRIYAEEPGSSTVVHDAIRTERLLERTRYLTRGRMRHEAGERQAPASAMRAAIAILAARSPRRILAAVDRVARLWRAPRPDIVHCHYGEVAMNWGFAGTLWSVPLVVSFYGYDASELPARYGRAVYGPLFQRCAAVVTPSEHMRDIIGSLGCSRERLRTLPLAVDTDLFKDIPRPPNGAGEPLRLLSVARLTDKKGLDTALQAVAVVSKRVRLRYDIVGDGPLRASLTRLVDELSLGDRVTFHGFESEQTVVRRMQEADVFLLPSTVAPSGDAEGTPTVLLEAAATGLPAISTRHAGIPEVVADGVTGLLVTERSVPDLVTALETLLADAPMRARMGQAGREFVRARFDVRLVSARLEAIYDEALGAA